MADKWVPNRKKPNQPPWSDEELDLIVASYFEMLQAETSGALYNKTAIRMEFMKKIDRSSGSIEFKHQNISSALQDLGKTWISGYKPREHTQQALLSKVGAYINERPELDLLITPTQHMEDRLLDPNQVLVAPPEKSTNGNLETQCLKDAAVGYDAAERDSANRQLGTKGEEFVFNLERTRLKQDGLAELAEKVEWTAATRGDGFGYDVRSFDANGDQMLIEVKTTNGPDNTPFYVTKRELEVSNYASCNWCLYRVFRYASRPRIFVLRPPLEMVANLEPTTWRVWPR